MVPIASIACEAGPTTRRHFIVTQNAQGRWSACESEGRIVRTFATQREAIHFALFETGTRCAAVSLTPST
jgi:hypothetical protein